MNALKANRAGIANPRSLGLAVSVLLGAIILASIYCDCAAQKLSFCLFHSITGLPCPSCGMTRAFIAIGNGDIISAISFNPASILVYITICIGLALALLQVVTGKKYIEALWTKIKGKVFPITLAVMVVAWSYNLFNHFI